MSLIAHAPGKLMIAGEYSVLFGGLALVASTPHHAIARFEAGPQWSFSARTNKAEYNLYARHKLFSAFLKTCKRHNLKLPKGSYYLDTSAFYHLHNGQKLGLGSSAAAVTALTKLLFKQQNLLNRELLLKLAQETHNLFSQNLGSGADVAASVYEEIILYQKTLATFSIKPINLAWWPEILWINTGRSQNTREFVKHVENFKNTEFMSNFVSQSNSWCKELISLTNFIHLRAPFEELYKLLDNLGTRCDLDIISDEHREIHNCAYALSGFAKPSGAGGGDLSLAWVPIIQREEFLRQLTILGFSILN